jgi:hypothetical protein
MEHDKTEGFYTSTAKGLFEWALTSEIRLSSWAFCLDDTQDVRNAKIEQYCCRFDKGTRRKTG